MIGSSVEKYPPSSVDLCCEVPMNLSWIPAHFDSSEWGDLNFWQGSEKNCLEQMCERLQKLTTKIYLKKYGLLSFLMELGFGRLFMTLQAILHLFGEGWMEGKGEFGLEDKNPFRQWKVLAKYVLAKQTYSLWGGGCEGEYRLSLWYAEMAWFNAKVWKKQNWDFLVYLEPISLLEPRRHFTSNTLHYIIIILLRQQWINRVLNTTLNSNQANRYK